METLATYRQIITEESSEYERIRERQNGADGEWGHVDHDQRGVHPRGRFEKHDDYFVVFDTEERMVMQGYGDILTPMYYDEWTDDEYGIIGIWVDGSKEEVTKRPYIHSCPE